MQISFLRAAFLVILVLILLGIYGLTPGDEPLETEAAATPTMAATATASEATAVATATPVTATPVRLEATASAEAGEPTLTVTSAPTSTTPAQVTATPAAAVVNSPNGLWLREAPAGTQEVALIAHETVLELLPGRETVGDLEWQQVITPSGDEGWVAVEFLIYQE
jgi:hypothetical protein